MDPFSSAAGTIAIWQLSHSRGLFVYGLTERPELCRQLALELACVKGLMKQPENLDITLRLQPEWQSKVSVLWPLVEGLQTSLEELDGRLKKVSVPNLIRLRYGLSTNELSKTVSTQWSDANRASSSNCISPRQSSVSSSIKGLAISRRISAIFKFSSS